MREEKLQELLRNQKLEGLTPQARALVEQERLRPAPSHLPEDEIFQRLTQTLGFRQSAPAPVSVPVAVPSVSKLKLATLLLTTSVVAGAVGAGVVLWSMTQKTAALQSQVEALQAEVRGWELHRETADLDPFEPPVISFSSSPRPRHAPSVWNKPSPPVTPAPIPKTRSSP